MSATQLNDFTPKIISKIIEYSGLQSAIQVAQVNRRYLDIVLMSKMWKNLNFGVLTQQINNPSLGLILAKCSKV